jgi:hypothetical protein
MDFVGRCLHIVCISGLFGESSLSPHFLNPTSDSGEASTIPRQQTTVSKNYRAIGYGLTWDTAIGSEKHPADFNALLSEDISPVVTIWPLRGLLVGR